MTFNILLIFFLIAVSCAQKCSSTSPCKVGCCAKTGNCGFGPAFCGPSDCVSDCDAKPECGLYAARGQEKCPLNVCCSQFGFCGTTSVFCGTGCQNGCNNVSRPLASGSSSSRRRVGYYAGWNLQRPCDTWLPEQINAKLWTHVNYAFALIDSSNRISTANTNDTQLIPRLTDLKKRNPQLKVFISVGGWDAGGAAFSKMVATAANRSTFIDSAIVFMMQYAFDGIDIDWEYPAAADRGGSAADKANLVQFVKELKQACRTRFGVSMTLPSSYWYMQGYDVAAMQQYVDWYNIMSYDIHGTWDGNNPYSPKVIAPHTNLTEISQSLDLLWRNKIEPSKVVLGLGYYGRSFTLTNSSCKEPQCAFSSGGNPGSCTGTSGILSNAEIERLIKEYSLMPILDHAAGVKYVAWDTDQWVSYDDQETFRMKEDFANKLGLEGLMVWSLDLDDPTSARSTINMALSAYRDIGDAVDDNPDYGLQKYAATVSQNNVQLSIIWTECSRNPKCPVGFVLMPDGLGHGKIFDADLGVLTADGCHGGGSGYNRALCIESGVQTWGCGWFGRGKSCKQICPPLYVLITQNTHIGGEKAGCDHSRFSSYCCMQFAAQAVWTCPATNLANHLSGGFAPRVADSNAVLYNPYDADLDHYGTELECAAARNIARGGLGAVDIIGGDIARLYINNHMPGYWTQGSGDFWWQPIHNRVYPSSTTAVLCTSTTTVTIETSSLTSTVTKTCDGSRWPQACLHYSSVIEHRTAHSLSVLTCPYTRNLGSRTIVSTWSSQHHTSWCAWMPLFTKNNRPGVIDTCQKDEYPPFVFAPNGAWIRYLAGSQNAGAGSLFKNVCEFNNRKTRDGPVQGGPIANSICTSEMTRTYLINAFSMRFARMPQLLDYGIPDNQCQPSITRDPGFALLLDDEWYDVAGNENTKKTDYSSSSVPSTLTQHRGVPPRPTGPWKRDQIPKLPILSGHVTDDPDRIFVDNGNVTRKATDEELFNALGLIRCKDKGCTEERELLGVRSPAVALQELPVTFALVSSTSVATTGQIARDSPIHATASRTGLP